MNVEKVVLSSGTTLLLESLKRTDIVSIRAFFRGGPCFDPPEKAGLSNLTYLLLLRDTRGRSGAEAATRIESVGGGIGCRVLRDAGMVSVRAPREGLEVSLETLRDALREPLFVENQIEAEKQSLLAELREEEDSPLDVAFRELESLLYGKHPYGVPVQGRPRTVKGLDRGDVMECYRRSILPDRLVVAASGGFDSIELAGRLEEALGDWEVPIGSGPDYPAITPPKKEKRKTKRREGDCLWMALGYLGTSFCDPDFPVLRILSCILGGAMDSRLFVNVRDTRGLCYDIGCLFSERRDRAPFVIYLGTSPESEEEALEAIAFEVKSLQESGPLEDELERSKSYLLGTYLMQQETTAGRTSLVGLLESLGRGYEYAERYPEDIRSVTVERVREAANRYLRVPSRMTIRPLAD